MRTTNAQLYKGLIIYMFHYFNFVYMLQSFIIGALIAKKMCNLFSKYFVS